MQILLKGYYGFGNLGDDILLAVTWKIVNEKYKDASILVYSNFNENLVGYDQVSAYNHYIYKLTSPNIKIVDWTNYHEVDLVIDGGGGVYFDYSNGSILRRITNPVARWMGVDSLNKLDIWLRRVTRKRRHIQFKKRIGVGLGIGPYVPAAKLFYQHLVEIGSTDVMLVRDRTSLKYLNELKFTGDASLCSDLAFCSEYWMTDIKLHKKAAQERNRVGIILLDWHEGMKDRFEVFRDFANDLIQAGKQITFFSFDENHDKAYKSYFQSQFNFEIWKPNEVPLNDFLSSLSAQDIIFSARAHGVILSALLGVPAICIGTSKKLEEVSKMFPTSSELMDEPVTVQALHAQVTRVTDHYDQILDCLTQDVNTNKQMAMKTLARLHQFL